MIFYQLLFLFRIFPFSILLLQDQNMKFFKKRLSKIKQAKSSTEAAASIASVNTDTNKPLPPSPSSTPLQPKPSLSATENTQTNHDSRRQLNLQNDDSSLLGSSQLKEEELPSDKLEIPPQINSKTSGQEVEDITECYSPSYPDNHIDTTAGKETTTADNDDALATAASSPSSEPSMLDSPSNDQQNSPLHVEKQGATLNDNCESLPALVDTTLRLTDDVQQAELVNGTGPSAEEVEAEENNEQDREEDSAFEEVEAHTPNSAAEDKVMAVGEETDQPVLEQLKEHEQLPTTITSLLENCVIVDQGSHDLLIAETPIASTAITPKLAASAQAEQSQVEPPQAVQPEPSPQLLQSNETSTGRNQQEDASLPKEISKMTKRKSVVSLIPRKQQSVLTEEPLQKSTFSTTLKSDRRGSSGSFIPVPARQHTNNTTNKDVLAAPAATWSASSSSSNLSLERNSVSSGSTSSSCSRHSQQDDKSQEKRPSIAKSHTTQQQSKIPKAAFGIALANHDIPKVTASTATTTQQQHYVSRLPTKRSSNV
ncbi:hypothetical protein BD408DRAFT_420065, partial [Parasitella parasitica]